MSANGSAASKALMAAFGVVMTVGGVTLILMWWPDVVAFVKGVGGMIIAVTGLLVLYMAGR